VVRVRLSLAGARSGPACSAPPVRSVPLQGADENAFVLRCHFILKNVSSLFTKIGSGQT
jgi:hypothetical protein